MALTKKAMAHLMAVVAILRAQDQARKTIDEQTPTTIVASKRKSRVRKTAAVLLLATLPHFSGACAHADNTPGPDPGDPDYLQVTP